MTITEFLNARLDADEKIAKAATGAGGPWAWEYTGQKSNSWAVGHVQDDAGNDLHGNIEPGSGVVIDLVCESINGRSQDAHHIGRHDPARVLREVEAKRKILAAVAGLDRWIGSVEGESGDHYNGYPPVTGADLLRVMTAVYSNHPDYRQDLA